MKKEIREVYVLKANGTEMIIESLEKALDTRDFLVDFVDGEIDIVTQNKVYYTMEVGDKVKWKECKDKNRIDILVAVTKDIFGSTRYRTEEIGGNKIGLAYENDIELVIE